MYFLIQLRILKIHISNSISNNNCKIQVSFLELKLQFSNANIMFKFQIRIFRI